MMRAAAEVPLVFGIYPGGAAGAVGPSGQTRPEIPVLRRRALENLRGAHRPFVLRLYDAYTRSSDSDGVPAWLASQVAAYAMDGFQIELVLAYRPADRAGDVAGFTKFVRARVAELGGNPGVTNLQVTNEANVRGAPNAADGAYCGAKDALVAGVIAAKEEARRSGHGQLRVGFNWAYQRGPAEYAFFSHLGATGGARFADAIDWVGVDAYPGTWGPALARGDVAAAVRSATVAAIRMLHQSLLPLARLSAAALHFSESGYPTGPGRPDTMQQTVMSAALEGILAARRICNVTDYRWFSLRDANSANPNFESHYGLMRDDYSPKLGFFAYRDLIAKLG